MKRFVWMMVCLDIILLCACGEGDVSSVAEAAPTSPALVDSSAGVQVVSDEDEVSAPRIIVYPEGEYKVGLMLPPGEYLVRATAETAYLSVTYESGTATKELTSQIFRTHTYITLEEGHMFEVTGAEFTLAEQEKPLGPSNGVYGEGMYKVGKDLAEGDCYIVITANGSDCSLEVLKGSSGAPHHTDRIYQVRENSEEYAIALTLEVGQYIRVTEGTFLFIPQ